MKPFCFPAPVLTQFAPTGRHPVRLDIQWIDGIRGRFAPIPIDFGQYKIMNVTEARQQQGIGKAKTLIGAIFPAVSAAKSVFWADCGRYASGH